MPLKDNKNSENEVQVWPRFDGITWYKQIPVCEETELFREVNEVDGYFIVEVQRKAGA